MRGKKGQFFLLAAVIISAVIISFGASTNRAIISDEPNDFYTASEETRREVAAFLDFAVFADFDDHELVSFLDELHDNVKDSDPLMNLAFVYGDDKGMYARNYGTKEFYVEVDSVDKVVDGRETIESVIEDGPSFVTVSKLSPIVHDDLGKGVEVVSIGLDENEKQKTIYVSGDRQVVMVMQKEVGGERYVSIG